MTEARGYLGRTPEGDRVWVEILLQERQARPGWQTTEHKPATTYHSLSISGDGVSKGQRNVDFGGQITDETRLLATVGAQRDPAWSASDILRLCEIWDRWHLNGMQAACAHQTPQLGYDQYGRLVPSLLLTKPCPLTGYRYGHAWLIEDIPADVLAEVRVIMFKLDGAQP